MANWKTVISLSQFKDVFEAEEPTKEQLSQLIQGLITELKANRYKNELQDIIVDFENLLAKFSSTDEDVESLAEEFDEFFDNLYDFGNTDHRIWIGTF